MWSWNYVPRYGILIIITDTPVSNTIIWIGCIIIWLRTMGRRKSEVHEKYDRRPHNECCDCSVLELNKFLYVDTERFEIWLSVTDRSLGVCIYAFGSGYKLEFWSTHKPWVYHLTIMSMLTSIVSIVRKVPFKLTVPAFASTQIVVATRRSVCVIPWLL